MDLELSIVIVNWNTREPLQNCLYSIYNKPSGVNFEVIVVDNASSDDSLEMVEKKFTSVKIVKNEENLGFAKANNQAIKKAKGKYILLLNPDTIILNSALDKMVEFMEQHLDAGAVGCKLLDVNGVAQRSWCGFPTLFKEFSHVAMLDNLLDRERVKGLGRILSKISRRNFARYIDQSAAVEVDTVIGACLMVRREVIDRIGLLDEKFFMYIEEGDWCYRMKKQGWKVYFFPGASIVHLGGESTKQVIDKMLLSRYKSLFHFFRKHYGILYFYVLKYIILVGVVLRMSIFFLGSKIGHKQRSLEKVTIAPINFNGVMEREKLWKLYKEVINLVTHYSE